MASVAKDNGSGGVFKRAAIEVLKHEKRFMRVKDITQRALDMKLLHGLIGKTPDNTMASTLFGELKKKKRNSELVKPAPGLFGLRGWHYEKGQNDVAVVRSKKRVYASTAVSEEAEFSDPVSDDDDVPPVPTRRSKRARKVVSYATVDGELEVDEETDVGSATDDGNRGSSDSEASEFLSDEDAAAARADAAAARHSTPTSTHHSSPAAARGLFLLLEAAADLRARMSAQAPMEVKPDTAPAPAEKQHPCVELQLGQPGKSAVAAPVEEDDFHTVYTRCSLEVATTSGADPFTAPPTPPLDTPATSSYNTILSPAAAFAHATAAAPPAAPPVEVDGLTRALTGTRTETLCVLGSAELGDVACLDNPAKNCALHLQLAVPGAVHWPPKCGVV